MEPTDLERLVDTALKALPSPNAPPTLLSRVMTAVEARAAAGPWYTRPWTLWPRAWQVASAGALFVLTFGLARFWMLTEGVRETAIGRVMPSVPAPIADGFQSAAAVFEAARIGWRVIAEPVLIPLTVFLCVMTAACMVFAAALNRVALGGASES
jgi:hypothetical protein